MGYAELVEKHPAVAFILLLLGMLLLAACLTILFFANWPKLTPEEARARPKFFAFISMCKSLGPVVLAGFGLLPAVFSKAAALELVNKKYGPEVDSDNAQP